MKLYALLTSTLHAGQLSASSPRPLALDEAPPRARPSQLMDKALSGPHIHGPNTVAKKVQLSLSMPRRRMEGVGTAPFVLNLGARWR